MTSAAAGKMLAAVQALGYVGVLQEGAGAVALRCRRPEPGGMWAVMVWQDEKLVFCWVVTPAGFVEKSVTSVLPYLEGEAATARHAEKRAETVAKSAATRALTAEYRDGPIGVRIGELRAAGVAVEWVAGGLIGDVKIIRKLAEKWTGEEHDERDRAGG